MALSCSISNRCGLTRRMASISATMRPKSRSTGLRCSWGGITVYSADHVGNLAQIGQQDIRPCGGFLELRARRLEGSLVACEQPCPHAKPARGRNVEGCPRTDVQDLSGSDVALRQSRQQM